MKSAPSRHRQPGWVQPCSSDAAAGWISGNPLGLEMPYVSLGTFLRTTTSTPTVWARLLQRQWHRFGAHPGAPGRGRSQAQGTGRRALRRRPTGGSPRRSWRWARVPRQTSTPPPGARTPEALRPRAPPGDATPPSLVEVTAAPKPIMFESSNVHVAADPTRASSSKRTTDNLTVTSPQQKRVCAAAAATRPPCAGVKHNAPIHSLTPSPTPRIRHQDSDAAHNSAEPTPTSVAGERRRREEGRSHLRGGRSLVAHQLVRQLARRLAQRLGGEATQPYKCVSG